MGWWEEDGNLWGDGPADILGDALKSLVEQFKENRGRKPTKAELRYGLEFWLGAYKEE